MVLQMRFILKKEVIYIMQKIQIGFENFKQLSSKTQLLIITCLVSALLFLFFGFRNAGNVYYNGNIYETGSLFIPKKYGSIANIVQDQTSVEFLDEQCKILRHKNLFPVLFFGGGLSISGYLSWKEDDFKDFLLTLR